MLKKIILLIIIITVPLLAQENKKLIREGNKLYEQQKYDEAEIQYMKANEKEQSHIAVFNMADALYKQGKFKEATEKFEELTAADINDEKLASVYHNLGNSYLKSKEYEKSIEAYKNALRRNPDDDDTRYNLEYAKKMLQKQQQQQQNQDNKNNENQDKNDKQDQKDKNNDKQDNKQQDNKNDEKKDGDDKQDQQQQGDNKEEQDKKDQQQQQGDKKDSQDKKEQQQQAQKREGKISKQDAERMLQALQEQERKLLKNLKKKKGESQNLEKNW